MKKIIRNLIDDILRKYSCKLTKKQYKNILEKSANDLKTFAKKDPSSKGDEIYILKSYLSYFAVLSYRIFYEINKKNKIKARKISENTKLITGIEIHPSAKIGKNFVIDHGNGTVIGETAIIGNNCYFLQNIILGSTKIANNPTKQRHPKIDNN